MRARACGVVPTPEWRGIAWVAAVARDFAGAVSPSDFKTMLSVNEDLDARGKTLIAPFLSPATRVEVSESAYTEGTYIADTLRQQVLAGAERSRG